MESASRSFTWTMARRGDRKPVKLADREPAETPPSATTSGPVITGGPNPLPSVELVQLSERVAGALSLGKWFVGTVVAVAAVLAGTGVKLLVQVAKVETQLEAMERNLAAATQRLTSVQRSANDSAQRLTSLRADVELREMIENESQGSAADASALSDAVTDSSTVEDGSVAAGPYANPTIEGEVTRLRQAYPGVGIMRTHPRGGPWGFWIRFPPSGETFHVVLDETGQFHWFTAAHGEPAPPR